MLTGSFGRSKYINCDIYSEQNSVKHRRYANNSDVGFMLIVSKRYRVLLGRYHHHHHHHLQFRKWLNDWPTEVSITCENLFAKHESWNFHLSVSRLCLSPLWNYSQTECSFDGNSTMLLLIGS